MNPEEMTTTELIDERASNKEQLDLLNKQIKELKQHEQLLDVLLLKKMDAEGLSRTANGIASASINEDTVPEITDWEAVFEHISQTGDYSLMQRRMSSVAYKEVLKLGEDVPGVKPRTVRRINFRKLN